MTDLKNDLSAKDMLRVAVHQSQAPEIGRWLWVLHDTRERTMRALEGVSADTIDWRPSDDESSIGTLLYHLADIEADWLYVEVLEQPLSPEVAALFPHPTRDAQGRLTFVPGFSLGEHLQRLATVRALLLDVYQQMTLTDFRRPRSLDQYDVTPEWVLHHLMQHEAEHRGQLGTIRARAERAHMPL
jgi:uncharacterized damage-inducible protein DinB